MPDDIGDELVAEVTTLFLLHKAGGLSSREFGGAKEAIGAEHSGGGRTSSGVRAVGKGAGSLPLFVRLPGERTAAIELAADATAADLHAAVAEAAGTMPGMRLSYQGVDIPSGPAALADMGITSEATLDVTSSGWLWRSHNGKGAPEFDLSADRKECWSTVTTVGRKVDTEQELGEGQHKWRVTFSRKTDQKTSLDPATYVGVVDAQRSTSGEFYGNNTGEWAFRKDGSRWSGGAGRSGTIPACSEAAPEFNCDDVIDLSLDLHAGTLRIAINGTQYHHYFAGITGRVRPCVGICSRWGCRIEPVP